MQEALKEKRLKKKVLKFAMFLTRGVKFREIFLKKVDNVCPNFKSIPTIEQKLIYLMTSENEILLHDLCEFLSTIYEKRLKILMN